MVMIDGGPMAPPTLVIYHRKTSLPPRARRAASCESLDPRSHDATNFFIPCAVIMANLQGDAGAACSRISPPPYALRDLLLRRAPTGSSNHPSCNCQVIFGRIDSPFMVAKMLHSPRTVKSVCYATSTVTLPVVRPSASATISTSPSPPTLDFTIAMAMPL